MRALPWVVVLVAASGCGKKKPNCGALSTHVAEVKTADEPPRFKQELFDKIRSSTDAQCLDGSYTADQIACMEKATTRSAINTCLGLVVDDPVQQLATLPDPPPPPPPPPEKVKPTFEQAAPVLGKYLAAVSDRLDVAFMHGCAEGFDRMDDSFDEVAGSSTYEELFVAAKLDPALNAALTAAIRDKSNPDLAAGMAKLEAKAQGCAKASEKMQAQVLDLLQSE